MNIKTWQFDLDTFSQILPKWITIQDTLKPTKHMNVKP